MENIEIYFESIRQVYNQILEWQREIEIRPEPLRQKITNFIIGASIVLFLLSLIPIIPSLFVFLGGRFSWVVFNFQLSQATIWTYVSVWFISTVITLLLVPLSFWLDTAVNPSSKEESLKPPQTLSSEQLTFIFVYQAYKELKIFFVSHIDQHIEKALDSLRELRLNTIATSPHVDFDEIYKYPLEEMPLHHERSYLSNIRHVGKTHSSLSSQIFIAREFLKTFEKYPWFHIDDLTKARLQALISFHKKILVRLRRREDLPAVLSILESLSRFLYAFLPEHQTNMSSETLNLLQSEGIKCLDKFVEDVSKLIDYPTKPHQEVIEYPTKKLTISHKIQTLYFSNIFVRFAVWLLMLLAITSGLVYTASLKISTLDINTMVSTIIATSITGATALAVIGTNPKKVVQELKNKSREQLHSSTEMDHNEDE